MSKIESELQTQGYSLPCTGADDIVTFEKVQERYSKNKIYLISAYYNFLNKKLEYIFTTKQIEKRRMKTNFKITNIK